MLSLRPGGSEALSTTSRIQCERWNAIVAILTLTYCVHSGRALEANSQSFRAQATLVTVPVTVLDTEGRPVAGLTVKSFRLFENDIEQEITVFDTMRQPISLCILVDASPSMRMFDDILRSVVDAIVSRLFPEDELTVLQFSSDVNVLLPWTSAKLRRQLDWTRLMFAGDSRIVSATRAALKTLSTARHERTVLLVVSDGKESEMTASVHALSETRRQTEALVYALHPYPPAPASKDYLRERETLVHLVGDSGGTVYRVLDAAEAPKVATTFLSDVDSAYVLGYTMPSSLDGTYRRLHVTVRYDDLHVRHRAGYLALPK